MVVGRTDLKRGVAINTIGPFWTVTRFGSSSPAPPRSLRSLLVRQHVLGPLPGDDAGDPGAHNPGVSFEYRGKLISHRWRAPGTGR